MNQVQSYKVLKKALHHPQNNPTERTNRTINTAVKAYIDDNHRKWDVHEIQGIFSILPQHGSALHFFW
jgi:hypothetical protein